jgi:HEAT repeat protein
LGRIGDSRAVEPLVMALGAADGATRRAAAQALVQFYRSGTLTADDKNLILGQREIMATPHGDQVHSWCNISSSHTDEGIGVLI